MLELFDGKQNRQRKILGISFNVAVLFGRQHMGLRGNRERSSTQEIIFQNRVAQFLRYDRAVPSCVGRQLLWDNDVMWVIRYITLNEPS